MTEIPVPIDLNFQQDCCENHLSQGYELVNFQVPWDQNTIVLATCSCSEDWRFDIQKVILHFATWIWWYHIPCASCVLMVWGQVQILCLSSAYLLLSFCILSNKAFLLTGPLLFTFWILHENKLLTWNVE